jgi:hypothetical protein
MTRPHEVLGVSPSATTHEVKEAYRELIKVWHPDRFAHDAKLQKKAQLKLQEINHAFEELSKPPAPVTTSFSHVSEQDLRPRNPWPLILTLAALGGIAAYFGIQSILSQRTINPDLFTQESRALSEDSSPSRYILSNPKTKEFYVIEGPRVPLDWEIGALIEAYTAQKPHTKQSLGQFTISQTMKPGEKLTPLQFTIDEAGSH